MGFLRRGQRLRHGCMAGKDRWSLQSKIMHSKDVGLGSQAPQIVAKPVQPESIPAGLPDLYKPTLRNALGTAGAVGGVLALGAGAPGPAFSGMATKFGLASICGYQTVWGVTPALHSPLMSVTNAVSGLTAVGGIVLMGGGLLPATASQVLSYWTVFFSPYCQLKAHMRNVCRTAQAIGCSLNALICICSAVTLRVICL